MKRTIRLMATFLCVATIAFCAASCSGNEKQTEQSTTVSQEQVSQPSQPSSSMNNSSSNVSERDHRMERAYTRGKKDGYNYPHEINRKWDYEHDVYINAFGVPTTSDEKAMFKDYENEYKRGFLEGVNAKEASYHE